MYACHVVARPAEGLQCYPIRLPTRYFRPVDGFRSWRAGGKGGSGMKVRGGRVKV